MTDPTAIFFDCIVMPAIDEYLEAEDMLTEVAKSHDKAALGTARQLVLRRGRTAAIELHQFADRVYAERPSWIPNCNSVSEVREWLKQNWCPDVNFHIDFDVLHTVADAFKHASLDRKSALFKTDKVVVTISSGWGEMRYGEGKYGGVEQLVIKINASNKLAMSMVLRTVTEAWRKAMS